MNRGIAFVLLCIMFTCPSFAETSPPISLPPLTPDVAALATSGPDCRIQTC